jgi:small subunit ribosomal protein S21
MQTKGSFFDIRKMQHTRCTVKQFANRTNQTFSRRGSTLAVGVKVRGNESIDRALKRFRRQVNRSRVLREFRQNMAYMKPSEEKRLRRKKSRRRRHRRRKQGRTRRKRQ